MAGGRGRARRPSRRPAAMTQNSKRRAVFLDRDGTVADEVGYINHVSRFRLYPWSAEAIRKINAAGLAAVVVTNQAGGGPGAFSPEAVPPGEEGGGGGAGGGSAPAPPPGGGGAPPPGRRGPCRKPQPGMLEQAARDLNLSLAGSVVITDRYMEVEMAHKLGLRC